MRDPGRDGESRARRRSPASSSRSQSAGFPNWHREPADRRVSPSPHAAATGAAARRRRRKTRGRHRSARRLYPPSGSRSDRAIAANASRVMSSLNAFRRDGRLKVMVATRSWHWYSTSGSGTSAMGRLLYSGLTGHGVWNQRWRATTTSPLLQARLTMRNSGCDASSAMRRGTRGCQCPCYVDALVFVVVVVVYFYILHLLLLHFDTFYFVILFVILHCYFTFCCLLTLFILHFIFVVVILLLHFTFYIYICLLHLLLLLTLFHTFTFVFFVVVVCCCYILFCCCILHFVVVCLLHCYSFVVVVVTFVTFCCCCLLLLLLLLLLLVVVDIYIVVTF